MTLRISRRGWLRGVGGACGAAIGTRLVGDRWMGEALAQRKEKSAVVVIHMRGGYNPLFCSADSFLGNRGFGVTNGNVTGLGNRLVVDASTLGALPQFARSHMATIGSNLGTAIHEPGIGRVWSENGRNFAIRLASAMGGDAAIKCAQVGYPWEHTPTPAEGGVSVQVITDTRPTIDALAGGDALLPDRAVTSKGLAAAEKMSTRTVAHSPVRSVRLQEGYAASIAALSKLAPPFDYRSLPAVYKTPGGTTAVNVGNHFATRMAAAEVMVRAGANVIGIFTPNLYDAHGGDGELERNIFRFDMLEPLQIFLSRVHDPNGLGATHNVVTVLVGDFGRAWVPRNEHQSVLSATVIGKYVKTGTTGRVSDNGGLPSGTPNPAAMWAYIASVAKVPGTPFGANPHPLVL